MLTKISEDHRRNRLARDNPWWGDPGFAIREAEAPRRVYFEPFKKLALNFNVGRAAILLGPRRVGKTFMIKQLAHDAIRSGIAPSAILYASVDAPIYSGISLETFVHLARQATRTQPRIVVFDEIQYLPDWETHLKDLVDNHPDTKFIASGSAAAALRLRSAESGAGRFSEFMLPPLTFYEFLRFSGRADDLVVQVAAERFEAKNIEELNREFVNYLNYGGYPEAVLNEQVRRNADQFVRSDIVDKVLLKDLPSLYGISDIKELNRLFSFLAYNAGKEASLEKIAQDAGVSKPTIKKYIEYLESAFLVIKLGTVDENCRSMRRERNFKIYLNNPSMRSALFTPVRPDDPQSIGHLAECAIFAQCQHAKDFRQLRYARWRAGEVDIVYLEPLGQKPRWIGEIKWSDRLHDRRSDESRAMRTMIEKHKSIRSAFITTRTASGTMTIDGRSVVSLPTALYCYMIGRDAASLLDAAPVSA